MVDQRRLAVHQRGRVDHACAERRTDRLMSETHAEDRFLSCGPLNEFNRDTSFARSARSRRYHDSVYVVETSLDLTDGRLVVADNLDLNAEFAQRLIQVERERVVVVEHEKHVTRSLELIVSINSGGPVRVHRFGAFDSSQQRAHLVEALSVLAIRCAVRDDPAPRLYGSDSVPHDHRAEGDAGVHATSQIDIADGASVDAA